MVFFICSARVVFLRSFYEFVRFAFGDGFINLFGSGTAISRQTILLTPKQFNIMKRTILLICSYDIVNSFIRWFAYDFVNLFVCGERVGK